MHIKSNLYLNEELFYFQIAACEAALEDGRSTPELLKDYRELLDIEADPVAMAFVKAQRWGSNY